MTLPEIIIHAVVICVGIPAAFRNPTALALVVSWAFGQGVWMITNDNLPLKFYILADLMVLAVIYIKPAAHDCYPYRSTGAQVAAFWCELSIWDRLVVAIFPLMWAVYLLPIGDYHRWWSLYYLCIAQILAAGGDAIQLQRHMAKMPSATEDDTPSDRQFRAWGRAGYG